MRWIFGLTIFLFGTVSPVNALDGVGALADRVINGGVEVTIEGKTAPWAEMVVVDEKDGDLVMAVAEVEKMGEFRFSFDVLEIQKKSLSVFAVDEAGITSRVPLDDFLKANKNVLMPATIINDLDDGSKDKVALTGFGYPESNIDIHIYNSDGFDDIYKTETDSLGKWKLLLSELPSGKYTGTAKISNGSLEGRLSQEIYFEIVGGQAVGPVKIITGIIKNPEAVSRAIVPVSATFVILPFLIRNGLVLLLRLFLALSNLFMWGKKKKNWGVVYDSVTKKPLSRAIVRLFNAQDKKLVETDVTGDRGVFSFLPPPSEYFLTVSASSFSFPSKLIAGIGNDGEYSHIYHGEVVKVDQDEAVVISMPMDPLAYKLGFWFYVRRLGGIAWDIISWILLGVGILSSSLALWAGFSWLNLSLFVIQVCILIWIIWAMMKKNKSFSVVVDGQNRPVSGAVVSLYDIEFNRMVQRRVTDNAGRFQMIVPPGKYKLEVAKEGYVVDLAEKGGFSRPSRRAGFDGSLIEIFGKKEKAIKIKVYLSSL